MLNLDCSYCSNFWMLIVRQIRLVDKIGEDRQLVGNASDWREANSTGDEIFAREHTIHWRGATSSFDYRGEDAIHIIKNPHAVFSFSCIVTESEQQK